MSTSSSIPPRSDAPEGRPVAAPKGGRRIALKVLAVVVSIGAVVSGLYVGGRDAPAPPGPSAAAPAKARLPPMVFVPAVPDAPHEAQFPTLYGHSCTVSPSRRIDCIVDCNGEGCAESVVDCQMFGPGGAVLATQAMSVSALGPGERGTGALEFASGDFERGAEIKCRVRAR